MSKEQERNNAQLFRLAARLCTAVADQYEQDPSAGNEDEERLVEAAIEDMRDELNPDDLWGMVQSLRTLSWMGMYMSDLWTALNRAEHSEAKDLVRALRILVKEQKA